MKEIEKIAVLGAGEMGHGIAELAALAGYEVAMRDIEEELVEKGYEKIEWSLNKMTDKGQISEESADAAIERIETFVDMEESVADADLVIEAAPEKMDLKKEIYSELDDVTPEHTILASNTSSLSITEMAKATERPEKVVGMHFFNPPVIMQLVEVIYGEKTADETADTIVEVAESMGKEPIIVKKDIRGFVVNTVLGPFNQVAFQMLDEGEATIREIDSAMVHKEGFPMGPFELSDLTGIDIGYHVRKEAGEPVPDIIEEKVEKNELGRKTGKGWYDYEEGEGADYKPEDGEDVDTMPILSQIINVAANLIERNICSREDLDKGMKLGTGWPRGPLEWADDLGIDNVVQTLQEMKEKYDNDRYEPTDLLKEMVEEGRTGKDAGEGFYSYGGEEEQNFRAIEVEVDRIAKITLNRPQRLNTINIDMRKELPKALENLEEDDEVRCVIIEGAGDRAFCAGADATEFGEPESIGEFIGRKKGLFEEIERFSKPTIAAIDGFALGGGLEIAMACDLRVASEASEVGQPEINLGLIPGGGGTQRLSRLVGIGRAKELIYTGDRISAEKAENWGLVNKCVPKEEFEEEVQELAQKLADGPPVALKAAKYLIDKGSRVHPEAGLEMEREAWGLLMETEDMQEGVKAFMEDREPEFKGK